MKTIRMIRLVVMATLISMVFVSCDKNQMIEEQDLPQQARTFIATHFQGQTMIFSLKERDDLSLSYEVRLSDGFELDFDRKGEVTNIDGNGSKLPDSVLPVLMREYLTAKFPGNWVTDWDKERYGQKVELDNGIELAFDSKGNFLRYED